MIPGSVECRTCCLMYITLVSSYCTRPCNVLVLRLPGIVGNIVDIMPNSAVSSDQLFIATDQLIVVTNVAVLSSKTHFIPRPLICVRNPSTCAYGTDSRINVDELRGRAKPIRLGLGPAWDVVYWPSQGRLALINDRKIRFFRPITIDHSSAGKYWRSSHGTVVVDRENIEHRSHRVNCANLSVRYCPSQCIG